MFDSSYRGGQSRYSIYFTAIDSVLSCLQGDQKSLVYGWKCPHYRRSNLRDRLIYDTRRARDHVWLPTSQNPDVRSSKFRSCPHNFLRTSDVWKITEIDSSEVSHLRGQSTGKNQNRGVALTFWAQLSRKPEVRTSRFCSFQQTFLPSRYPENLKIFWWENFEKIAIKVGENYT